MVAERRIRWQSQQVTVVRLGVQSFDWTPVNVQLYMYSCQVNALSCSQCLPRSHVAATRVVRATGCAPR
jgi:hypothetical protein